MMTPWDVTSIWRVRKIINLNGGGKGKAKEELEEGSFVWVQTFTFLVTKANKKKKLIDFSMFNKP
jgi:hypothetical protein